jgi:hypothetical protein
MPRQALQGPTGVQRAPRKPTAIACRPLALTISGGDLPIAFSQKRLLRFPTECAMLDVVTTYCYSQHIRRIRENHTWKHS